MKRWHLAVAVLCLLSGGTFAEEPAKAKILFIGKEPDHPYGSHMYLHALGVLAKCAEKSPGVETFVSKGWPEDKATLEGVKAIVMYTSPAAEFLLDSPNREAFQQQMKRGAGLVTIHWASSIKKENLERLGPAWQSFLGGTWVSNVGLSFGKSPLEQLKPDHPICRGWSEYEIDDEYYLNPTVGKATPLLRVKEPKEGKEVIVGWAYERPEGGRSFATTLGHPYANFQREPFRRMLVNAILWAAKVEVPKDGADVGVSKELLDLPPQE
jgi:type 1 glutamine amidotransferase